MTSLMLRTGIPVSVLEREDEATILTLLDLLTPKGD
jgi:hypothetical protein